MSTALWVKRGNGLAPADSATEALIIGIKQGDYVRTTAPRRPRNPKHHRLMMAILQIVVEHTWPRFADIDALIKWLKRRSEMSYEILVDGVIEREYESIDFVSMDQIHFKTLSEAWLAIICAPADEGGLMPGTDPEELLKEAA